MIVDETDPKGIMLDEPYVRCARHGKQFGYVVCLTVWNKIERPARTSRAKDKQCGEICCSVPGQQHTVDDLLIVCEECAIRRGILLRLQ